jgi:hypothetical protein
MYRKPVGRAWSHFRQRVTEEVDNVIAAAGAVGVAEQLFLEGCKSTRQVTHVVASQLFE